MTDFYQQRATNAGVFQGRTLITASGAIGGQRYVFVKLAGSAKNGLVYPTSGGKLVNPFKGNAKIFAGDLIEYNPGLDGKGATVKILKTYEVAKAASSATEVYIARNGFRHIPFVGDTLTVAPAKLTSAGTALTVTAVEATTDATAGDVWKVTVSTAVTASKGAVLIECGTDGKAIVTNPNAFAPCDYDFVYTPESADGEFDGAKYLLTPCLANEDTKLYIAKMSPLPSTYLALNESKVEGWFNL